MLLQQAANYLLAANPEIRRELSGYNGLTVTFRLGSNEWTVQINDEGLLHDTEQMPAARIILPENLPVRLLQGDSMVWTDIQICGDEALGWRLLALFASLEWQNALALPERIAENAASAIQQLGRKAAAWLENTENSRAEAVSSRDTAELQQSLAELTTEIRTLHQEVARLNRRLNALEEA
ncbi:MAG: hypothetical protein Q4D82_08410 [Neisseria sp.]|nr:hypothetical protein [Neisseria sp.]